MKPWLLSCLCVVAFGLASAAQAAPQRPMVEASMLITGTIMIAPDGSVRSHAIDHPEKVPVTIREFVGNAIAAWKFEPIMVDGKPVVAHTNMNMRLVIDPVAHGSYALRVGGVSFAGGDPSQDLQVDNTANRRYAPQYPSDALRAFAGGTVYLLLKVGRQGQVLDAAAEQVNLTVWGSPEKMAKLRAKFANAALLAAQQWTYIPPTTGPSVDRPYWYARVPVEFRLSWKGRTPSDEDEYGHWQPYVRGPQESVPWDDVPQLAADAVDTTSGGSVLPLAQGPQLTIPPSGG